MLLLEHRRFEDQEHEQEKEWEKNARFAFALTAQIMRLTFVAADFARVAQW
jgi:hypothetical protein